MRLHDSEDRGCSHRGVDGIAALLQDVETGCTRERNMKAPGWAQKRVGTAADQPDTLAATLDAVLILVERWLTPANRATRRAG